MLNYRIFLNNDKIKKEKERTIQCYRTRKNRAKDNKTELFKLNEKLNKFKSDYKKKSKKYENGSLSESEFIEWIKKQK